MNKPAPMLNRTRDQRLPQALVAHDLQQVESILSKTLAPYQAQLGPLLQHLQNYRGKRLRPTLLLLIAHACGRQTKAHLTLAAVIEMIHTATLVHDDVLDEADTRRHIRTINAGWGNQTSILLGDLLFTSAFHLSSTIGDARACEAIGAATNRVCAGEMTQSLNRGNLHLSEDEYFAIIEGKTASLLECGCRLGALYAGAEPDQIERLAGYGRDLGIAFQIADDVLDLEGSERTAGKTLGTDLAQRKLTLPLIYLLERVGPVEAKRFRDLLEQERVPTEEIREALRETGALEDARSRALAYAENARTALSDLPPSPHRDMLEAITGWAVRREE